MAVQTELEGLLETVVHYWPRGKRWNHRGFDHWGLLRVESRMHGTYAIIGQHRFSGQVLARFNCADVLVDGNTITCITTVSDVAPAVSARRTS